jgi:hypothetical protein
MTIKFLRKLTLLLLLAFTAPVLNINLIPLASAQTKETEFCKKLKALPGVVDVEQMKCDTNFKEKYLVTLKQFIDHTDTTIGTFNQRVFVSHYSYDAPMVLVTEGYTADYADDKYYVEELAKLFHANQICVEHRYFGKSFPADTNWTYLTEANSAADHHHVVELFKTIYKKKWINTGISKGGETALIHRAFYPKDVDISVCYVAPLCFGLEDGRHEPFITKISTEADRTKVRNFQVEILKRKKKLMAMFDDYCTRNNFTFHLPKNQIYDFCVLEFSFAFWQWGYPVYSIPSSKASDKELFSELMNVSSPEYFSVEGAKSTLAFYIQAAKEMGYYGYDTKPFEKYLTITSSKDYLSKIWLPKNYSVKFDSTLSKKVASFISNNDPKMIFIYGQFDPWSAAAVTFSNKVNMFKAVCPGGCHATRIHSLPADMKKQVMDKLTKWLND